MNAHRVRSAAPGLAGRAATLFLAGLLNFVILLLIDALVGHRGMVTRTSDHRPPIDFIRVHPKPRPEEPPRPATVAEVSGDDQQDTARPGQPGTRTREPVRAEPKRAAEPKPKPQREPRPPRTPREPPATVAAPRIEAPATGSGPPVPANTGSAPRVHGPPGQWSKGTGAGRATGDRGSGSGEGGGGGSGNSGVVVLSRVLPAYPPSARNQRIQGWVLVEITVSRTGAVSAAQVVDAQPLRLFDQAALDAIRRWKFKPAYRDGQSVEQHVRQRIHFRLN